VDQQALVKELNEDLGTEHQSLVQYIQHTATISGAEYMSVVDELRRHLAQELEHALILAEQVSFLGGIPETAVPPVPPTNGPREALEADLALESNQLDRYRERIIQATEIGLVDVAEALRPLLEQTQEHVRDLRTALGK
jgi:bacterioferritin